MKEVILLILLVFASIGNLTAQDNNSATTTDLKNYVDSLSIKLNTLQHDYDYLYCNYMLSDIQLQLKDFENALKARSNDILISCHHSRFDRDLYSVYRAYYNSCIDLHNTMKERVEIVTTSVASKIATSNFSNDEILLLGKGCSLVKNCLSTAQSYIDYYKVVLDVYRDLK